VQQIRQPELAGEIGVKKNGLTHRWSPWIS
jgi:hypothetical protein